MNTATTAERPRYAVRVTYHFTNGDSHRYIAESGYGRLRETSCFDEAAFYSTVEDALARAERYADGIRERSELKATLKVMRVDVAPTDNWVRV